VQLEQPRRPIRQQVGKGLKALPRAPGGETLDAMPTHDSRSDLTRFYGIDDADLEMLASARPIFEESADRMVDEFYEHLMRFPETAALLQDEEVRRRLLDTQREYLLSLSEPRIDDAYIARRQMIGTTHERVGLGTRFYLGAYTFYFRLLVDAVRAKADPADNDAIVSAIAKRLFFDANIAISQYIDRREADLKHLNDELTHAGRALSREVDETSRNLRHTTARAQAAEQLASVGTLVSGLAHEIGTPMGVLRGHAESLESAIKGDRERWRLKMILEQIDRITSIIQSLLGIARPRESVRVPLDLPATAQSSATFVGEKTKKHGVQFILETRPHPPVLGDPEKLQQVFLNLYINALDAMPDGGTLLVTIDGGDAGERGQETTIEICDSGAGIAKERLAEVFDPFYTTKAAGHGSGLGLMVAKGIIEEIGGRISVASELNQGTEFRIVLPSANSANDVESHV
jgi:signal transduction histidine kinase